MAHLTNTHLFIFEMKGLNHTNSYLSTETCKGGGALVVMFQVTTRRFTISEEYWGALGVVFVRSARTA